MTTTWSVQVAAAPGPLICSAYFASSATTPNSSPAQLRVREAISVYERLLEGHLATAYRFQAARIDQAWRWLLSAPRHRARTWRSSVGLHSLERSAPLPRPEAAEGWRRQWLAASSRDDQQAMKRALSSGLRSILDEVERVDRSAVNLNRPSGIVARALHEAVSFQDVLALVSELTSAPQFSLILPDQLSYSISELNDLSPYPIFLLGLIDSVTTADGVQFYPMGFLGHDGDHARTIKQLAFDDAFHFVSTWQWSRARFQAFIRARAQVYAAFQSLTAQVVRPGVRQALRLLWFEMFHEFELRSAHRYEMSARGILRALDMRPKVSVDSPIEAESEAERIVTRSLGDRSYGPEVSAREVNRDDIRVAVALLRSMAHALPDALRAAEPPSPSGN